MSINNSRDLLAYLSEGLIVREHVLTGSNRQLAPGTYVPDWDNGEIDAVTFTGTSGRDVLFGGGGEVFTFFIGSRGDDLFGTAAFTNAYVDYSGAGKGVIVDMGYRGSRTFTDQDGAVRTVAIVGRAHDGYGGTDYFAQQQEPGLEGLSSIIGVIGSSHADVMIGGGGFIEDFFGGRGNDLLIGTYCEGGDGNDRLIALAESSFLQGDAGNDWIVGSNGRDIRLVGGEGNDIIFARAGDDPYVTGDEGNDFIDGGAGNDFIDGGVGRDTLVSGAGNDTINPDVEFFQLDPSQPRDCARDLILVTRADLGAYTDMVLFNAFEENRDQIHFRDAVRRGQDFRVYHEDDADGVNTVLQIDVDGDGFGGDIADTSDYFLRVYGAELSLYGGFILT